MTHVSNPSIPTAQYIVPQEPDVAMWHKTHLCKWKTFNFFYLLIVRRLKKHNFKYSGNYFRVQALHKNLLNLKIFCVASRNHAHSQQPIH